LLGGDDLEKQLRRVQCHRRRRGISYEGKKATKIEGGVVYFGGGRVILIVGVGGVHPKHGIKSRHAAFEKKKRFAKGGRHRR